MVYIESAEAKKELGRIDDILNAEFNLQMQQNSD